MRLSYLFNAVSLIFFYIGIVAFSPAIVSLIYQEYNSAIPFVITGILSGLIGLFLKLVVNRFLPQDKMTDIKKSEGLTIVLLSWLVFSVIASIPYLFFNFSVENAFFEGISGATTTGATILTHYDYPKALFFWRSLTQWLGGMGIIVLFIAVLPQFAVAGRQMFFAEAPGPTEDKLTPRIKNTATALWGLYVILTLIQIGLLVYFKMPLFDAICNSFSTISSGGFSPNPQSIAGYGSLPVMWVIIVFMFFSGCNLALVYRVLTKFKYSLIWKNEEFKTYLKIIVLVSLSVFGILFLNTHQHTLEQFTNSVFTVLSIMTSTGFASCDYSAWSVSAQIMLFIVILFGSSAGSTGGGIKIMRALIVFKYLKRELVKLLHPNAVITIKMDNVTVAPYIVSQIIAFIMFYIAVFIISGLVVSIIESNVVIGFGGSMATLSIIGPAFGHVIGPAGNYESLSAVTKLIFMFNMLIGRLELIPFLILLNKDYWSIKR
ncbi:TrkH family potassium uptake protein [bacterium]|nr:TrkH family potassium uptake protein [bacterium]